MTELTVPADWDIRPLGEVARLVKKPKTLDTSQMESVPFAPMALIPDGSIELSRWETRAPTEVRSGVYFEEGNVLLAKITPCLENGKQALVPEIPGGWGYATTEVFPLAGELVTGPFLDLYLRNRAVREVLASKMQGTTGRQRLPKDALMSMPVPVPPIAEQRAIAHVLRTVQQAKEATEQVITAAREVKKSLMRHLIVYGMVPIEETSGVDIPETVADEVGSRWTRVAIGDFCGTSTGGTPDTKRPDYFGGDVPWVKSGEVRDARITRTSEFLTTSGLQACNARLFPENTLLMAMYGAGVTAGRVAQLGSPAATNQAVCAILPTEDRAIPEYLFQILIHLRSEVRAARHGSNQPNLSQRIIKRLRVPLPPVNEQRVIVEAMRSVDAKLAAEEARRHALANLFDSLLHDLMAARLRVADLEVSA